MRIFIISIFLEIDLTLKIHINVFGSVFELIKEDIFFLFPNYQIFLPIFLLFVIDFDQDRIFIFIPKIESPFILIIFFKPESFFSHGLLKVQEKIPKERERQRGYRERLGGGSRKGL